MPPGVEAGTHRVVPRHTGKLERTMEEGTQPLSVDSSVVQDDGSYRNHLIRTDISKELLEEDNPDVEKPETGLTEVMITIECKEVKTLVDTGS